MTFTGRVICDDVALYDRNDSLLLQARRVAAKMEWLPLISEGSVSIANAQLLSADLHLYHTTDSTLNLQFLIDIFSPPDKEEHTPLNLHIGSLIIRRSAVRLDSVSVRDINLTAHLHRLTDDSLSLSLKRLSLSEGHGMRINQFSLECRATRSSFDLDTLHLNGTIPATPYFPAPTDIVFNASGNEHRINVSDISASSSLYDTAVRAEAVVNNVLTHPSLSVLIHRLSASGLPEGLNALGDIFSEGSIHSDLRHHVLNLNTHTAIGYVSAEGTLHDDGMFKVSVSTDTLNTSPLLHSIGAGMLHKCILDISAEGQLNKTDGLTQLTAYLDIPMLVVGTQQISDIHAEGTRHGRDTELSLSIDDPKGHITAHAQVTDDRWKHPTGTATLENVCWWDNNDGIFMPPLNARLAHTIERDKRHLSFSTDDIQLEASGTLHDSIDFAVSLSDTLLLRKFAGMDLRIPEQSVLIGSVVVPSTWRWQDSRVSLDAQLPEIQYVNETLSETQLRLRYDSGNLHASLSTERNMPMGATSLSLNADGTLERLRGILSWDNHRTPLQQGTIDATVLLGKDSLNKTDAKLWIAPTDITINDTTWHVRPATAHMHDGVIDVAGIYVTDSERNIRADGRISKNGNDTLTAHISNVNVAYIMDLVKFDDVLFGGNANGTVHLTNLMTNPVVDARARVDNFTFNHTPEGVCDAHLTWGRTPSTLDIWGHVYDTRKGMDTYVDGLVVPGRRPESRLELNIDTRRFDLGFLNFFTEGIIEELHGTTSGHAFVGGPLGRINLSGRLHLDSLSLYVPYTGVRYHLDGVGEDSVLLEPDHIRLVNAHLMDSQGTAASPSHYGLLQGHIQHRSFKNLKYDFSVSANDMLSYDMKSMGDQPFYGTLFSTGDIRISGGKGLLQVDASITPEKGSSLTYSVSRPSEVSETSFITYVTPPKAESDVNHKQQADAIPHDDLSSTSASDIRINLDMDMTPGMRLRLLLDQKSDDALEVGGTGHLLAKYYNKGRFNLYGTYTLSDGSYRMTFQDVLRRDFIFRPGGTIVFSGNPMLATINMQAAYIVPNVSLNDLSSSSLGFNNTRVDCIMNVTGRPTSPLITFDFDLPNATEDEKRIVHSMISTEEERNMQVIYLLGVGRFYSYAAQNQRTGQTGTAMYSLMASTISQQFNQLIGNALGSNNWNFGANLRTGDTGWDNVDVEGMLSGRLFSGRLLVNGNFGYRESYYTTRNIITDVDVQYLLTPHGSIALKAYNKTNDRYFVQNSFNTQGVGIQLQKDFSRLRGLFLRNR